MKSFLVYFCISLVAVLCIGLFFLMPTLLVYSPLFVVAGVFIYAAAYFHGAKFKAIKDGIATYIQDCNELNNHITELRDSFVGMRKTDYGEATYQNISKYNYKRNLNTKYAPNIYDCSRQICDSARKQPFKYICKYFNIKETKESLDQFEQILNNFDAAEEGKVLSRKKRTDILASIDKDIPWVIKKLFKKRLEKELGFEEFRFDEVFYPTFSFRYVSSGGKSGTQFDVTFDIPMLERFCSYLSDVAKFKASAEGQRRLMTPALRRHIIARDNHTCKLCGNSTMVEPNLLLEVDHIIPVSKGGLTAEDNLQTLCWKCNRHKGAKIA